MTHASIHNTGQLITARQLRTVTASATNLFAIAAEELGDATQWNRIARLNGLTDPFFDGIVTLKIPRHDPAGGNGGVLK